MEGLSVVKRELKAEDKNALSNRFFVLHVPPPVWEVLPTPDVKAF